LVNRLVLGSICTKFRQGILSRWKRCWC